MAYMKLTLLQITIKYGPIVFKKKKKLLKTLETDTTRQKLEGS